MSRNWIVALLVFAAACSGSTEVATSSAPSVSPPATSDASGETAELAATDELAATATTVDPDPDPEPDSEPATATVSDIADEPGLPAANGVEIEQLTPKVGGGVRPILAWAPSEGAASYTVVVYDAEGVPWWSWSGTDTGVVIGGVDTDVEIGGPRADVGVRWTVMALDTDGNLVGSSAKRSVEP